jgi:UDP:flavonoid glycosyltransferase YjiC (YdhE family)
MRLLIPVFSPATGTWGGLTRSLAIAEAAQKAGHEVAFCASGSLEKTLLGRGYYVYSMPRPTMFGLPEWMSNIMARRSQRMAIPVKPGRSVGSIWLVMALSGMAKPQYLHCLFEAEWRASLDFDADILFTDLDPGAFLLSALTGLPIAANYASVVLTGMGGFFWKVIRHGLNNILKRHGHEAVDPQELLFRNDVLKIIPSIPELDDTDPALKDVCFTGYLLSDILPEQTFVPEPGKRYVFVYSGTGSITLTRLEEILPQVFPEGGEYICLVGAQTVKKPYRIGAVEFRPYVPAPQLLPYCDWTICHGGQNTIIQSLRAGVPLILFPGPIFERRFNAAKVERAGAGKMGELDQFSAQWLKEVMKDQQTYAAKARGLKTKILALGGADAAVKRMEKWLTEYGLR